MTECALVTAGVHTPDVMCLKFERDGLSTTESKDLMEGLRH